MRFISTERFRKAVSRGILAVLKHEDYLNRINVFPVPDRDTGSNIAHTLRSVLQVTGTQVSGIDELTTLMSRAALRGARGNSGIIISQFIDGLRSAAEKTENKKLITRSELQAMLQNGAVSAYEAVSEPVEGTILTIFRKWAEYENSSESLSDLYTETALFMREQLEMTPGQLKVLRRNSVVDSGALAIIYFIEGVAGIIETGEEPAEAMPEMQTDSAEDKSTVEKYRYCTEVLFETAATRENIREKVQNLGNSLVVAGSAGQIRVHVHTDEPEELFRIAAAEGEIIEKKSDDMKEQVEHHSLSRPGIVVDSSADLEETIKEAYNIETVPLRIRIGGREYKEKLEISSDEIYSLMQQNDEMPATSQPSPADFEHAFEKSLQNHRHVFCFCISSSLSGTIQSARVAAKKFAGRVSIIDTWSVSGGIALIVKEFIDYCAETDDPARLQEFAHQLRERTHYLLRVPDLTNFIRGGRITGLKAVIIRLLKLKPLIMRNEEGRSVIKEKAFTVNRLEKHFYRHLDRITRRVDSYRLTIAHFGNRPAAEKLAVELEKRYGVDLSDISIKTGAPVTGIYTGSGSIALFIQS